MHLAFFETMAGVIPIVFLALIVEERVAPSAEDFWDYMLPLASAGCLIVGEALALLAVYRGNGSSGLAGGVSLVTAVGAFLLLGDAAVGRADAIANPELKQRVVTWSLITLGVVIVIVTAIGVAGR